ncbi:GPP34 family phosphoprotein [Streptomyces sp. HC307]|uniref:GPP34 family phosphoprotein n=1 Tax=Streptomyces flavusporus TaxID=3385496 RepID=UPI00391762D3
MTTSRDLMIIAIDVAPNHPVEQGDLSLALAGAEVLDLLDAQAITLDGDHIVPGHRPTARDSLLDQAASSLVREAPYETVGDWLWRRGRGLSAAYLAALEAEGQLRRQHHRRNPFRTSSVVPADSPDHRAAAQRWASDEPTLAALAAAIGIHRRAGEDSADSPSAHDDAVDTVLAAVHGALVQLEAIRQRRAIEQAAFDNIWRGE